MLCIYSLLRCHAETGCQKHRFPIRIEDWGMQSGVTMTPDLVQMIKSHDAIEFNERNHLYSYRVGTISSYE